MRDRKLHYFWGSWKNPSFRGGFHKKPIYRGDCLKMGARTVCRFKGGLGKKERVVFLRGKDWYPNAHYLYTWKIVEGRM